MDNKLQSPFTICSPGTCPACFGHSLVLVESDIDVSIIDNRGLVSETMNMNHSSKLVCSNCKKEFDFVKKGMFIVPQSKFSQRFELLYKEKLMKDNHKNPFSI